MKKVKYKVQFDFYGTVYNQQYWNGCKEILNQLPLNIQAEYKGEIENRKVSETLKQYHFMLMPTLGENFGHIIIESLDAGCPVIISDKTPWKNLEEKKIGWDIPLNEKEKFIEVIERCAEMNNEEYNQWSKNAFNFAKEFQNNSSAVEQNRNLFLFA